VTSTDAIVGELCEGLVTDGACLPSVGELLVEPTSRKP
jgi:hypothetical protein